LRTYDGREWPQSRLKYLFREIDRRVGVGSTETPLLSVSIHRGVVPRAEMTDRESRADEFGNYKEVTRGDIVINRMRAFQGGAGISSYHGMVSADYAVLRTQGALLAEFFHYLIRSDWFVGEMTARLRGIGSADLGNVRTPRINIQDLGDIAISLPRPSEQGAIAAYLRVETARIEQIVAAKQRLRELVWERYWSEMDAAFTRFPRLEGLGRFALSMTDGPFGSSLTSAHYSDDQGARVIRLGNIGRGNFRDDDRAFVSTRHYELLKRHDAVANDLVVAGLGDERHPLGRACVVPEHLGPAIVKADCFRFRLNQERLAPDFAALFLSSPTGESLVQGSTRGSTRQRANIGALASVRVPAPPLKEQQSVVAQLRQAEALVRCADQALDAQVGLLSERRQALITAAVTGQLHIPGVAA
jgi:type I restriction enzyme S subunit